MLADAATVLWTTMAVVFGFGLLAWTIYALVRPWTHTHHHHDDHLWRPLD